MKTVLHILPHPGGGGETYVNTLAQMSGFLLERVFLSRSPSANLGTVASAARAHLRASRVDLVHIHGEVAAALLLPTIALRPSVLTLHGLNLLRRLGGRHRSAAALNLRLAIHASTVTICISETERDEIVATVGPRVGERTVVIHNGVAPAPPVTADERRRARAELGVDQDRTLGVFIGSLEEHKDPMTAARAAISVASEGASFGLMIVGDGPLRGELEHLAAEHDGVLHVLGFRRGVRTVLAAADLLVLPSQREGLSYALLEAMSVGLPPVVSDAPGNTEAVGETGIVVPRSGVDAFAAAFRRLLEPDLRSRLGTQARHRALEAFTEREMVKRTSELYKAVIESRRPVAGSPPR